MTKPIFKILVSRQIQDSILDFEIYVWVVDTQTIRSQN